MANRRGRSQAGRPPADFAQLMVTGLGALVIATGVWLWFLGERSGTLAGIEDPFVAHRWIGAIHWIASIGFAVVIASLLFRAVFESHGMQAVLLLIVAVLLAAGFATGYRADWDASRLWASTTGSKVSVGLPFGDGASLPASLRDVRVHVALVPAALLLITIASLWHYRRS